MTKEMSPPEAFQFWGNIYRRTFGDKPGNGDIERAYIHRWVHDRCVTTYSDSSEGIEIPFSMLPERYHWVPILWTYRYDTYEYSGKPDSVHDWLTYEMTKNDLDKIFAPGTYDDFWDFLGDHTDNHDLRTLGIPFINPRKDWAKIPQRVKNKKTKAYNMARRYNALDIYEDLYHLFQLLPKSIHDPVAKRTYLQYEI